MSINFKRLMQAALSATVMASLAVAGAQAQTYPTKPVTIVVPFAAGGPTDTVSRLIGEAMSADLGQQVLIQNVGGAGGTVGAGQVANAAPDGYTLLISHIGMSTAPTLYKDLPFNTQTSFAPIGLITRVPMTIVARKTLEANTLAELGDYIKANGLNVTYAHAGIGSASHLCGLLYMSALGTQMTTVPYQGSGPAMTDIVGNQVDLICDQTTNTTSQIKGGEVKAYAVTTPARLESLPDLPTAEESGLAGFEVSVWHGLWAPAGTSPEILARLEQSLQVALSDAKVTARFAELGTSPVPASDATPAALADTVATQTELWKPIIEAAGALAQ